MIISRFKNAKKKKKMTNQQLADCLHVTKNVVINWGNGISEPHPDMLLLLAHLLGCSCDYLLGKSDTNSDIYDQLLPDSDWLFDETLYTYLMMYLRLDELGRQRVNELILKEYQRCLSSTYLKDPSCIYLSIFSKCK